LDEVTLPDTPGRLWLCGKRVVGPDPEAALRRADNANAVVSFNERHELLRDYPGYVAWLDRHAGNRALWWPVPDLGAPRLADAQPMVHTMVKRLKRGDGLILHCAGGIGRAPTMATCVLIGLGMTVAQAQSHIAASRPMAGPEAGAQQDLVDSFSLA
jgi:protein-tyrosine phosphatase